MEGARRIQQIVDDLKNFVRKDKPDMTERVDVNVVVKSAISLVDTMIRRATNRFTVRYGSELPLLVGNNHRLEQVVINLIQNACQALTDPQSGIEVFTTFDGANHNLVITVKDRGKGIPQESLPYITDTFYTTKYENGGVGLGLSIAAKIVDEHDGRMVFHSEEGKGTRVDVILPVKPATSIRKEMTT
jgi:polar amino acid transport system substrate-binding protein